MLVVFESCLLVYEYYKIYLEDVVKNFIVWVVCGIFFFYELLYVLNFVLEKGECDYFKGGVCLFCNECGYLYGCLIGIFCLI